MKTGQLSRFRKITRKISAIGLAFFAGLLLADGFVSLSGADWRYIEKNLYFQNADRFSHMPDPNPALLFRLRPNSNHQYGGIVVNINSVGARGPERSAAKPEGVFRIVCLGGSNVYGTGLQDRETWPAQLEAELNRGFAGRFEVWNMGTCAYVGVQMAALAREVLTRYQPDLFVFGLSNIGAMAFLYGESVKPYFRRYPVFWQMLIPTQYYDFPSFFSDRTKLWLIAHWRLYRMYVLAQSAQTQRKVPPMWFTSPDIEKRNVAAVRGFLLQTKQQVGSCLLVGPYGLPFDELPAAADGQGQNQTPRKPFWEYYDGIDAPVFYLGDDSLSEEYRDVHPNAEVAAWYGRNIAAWLMEKELIPGRGSSLSIAAVRR